MILHNPEKTDTILHYSGIQIHSMSKSISEFNGIYELNKGGTKFLVSRDPYGRLLSGYLDKIYLMKFPLIACEIAQMVQGKAALHANSNCITDITFLEFLKYLIIRSKKKRSLNNHFEPIFAYCNPCSVLYDYILKVESLSTEAEHLLRMANVEPSAMESIHNLLHDSIVETRIQGTIPSAWKVGYLIYKCFSKIELAKRLWKAFQIQGYLRDSVDFREELFPLNISAKDMGNIFVKEYLRQNVSKEERSHQKKRLMSDFYRSIDDITIHGIQELFRMDFLLFDYDIKPPIFEA
ncbi:hypothetical protein CHS0354_007127 [Potamilus streckersoni]|uniref:Carbohydrate sulfotransferase n=1 Tax=Potamilus streckersoni TaxID=2493646 RepID=A0AAE0T314_9BIVA|nr:hypothetical protein CHS0354_007127 [Potamilus streckersoni]